MKITKKHVGKYVKKEGWFYSARITYVDEKQFVYKNMAGNILIADCDGDWQIEEDKPYFQVAR
jgi:hypothetical protein